jgi:hypothetical protein
VAHFSTGAGGPVFTRRRHAVRSGVREPSSTLGFRAVSNRTDHDSRRCGAEFESARRGPPIQHSRDRSQRGRVRARSRAGGRVAKRTGRCCCTSKARAHGRPALGRSHARRRSGPEWSRRNQSMRSWHSNASVRPRRARRAAGGTPRPRPPATRLRQCVAAEQLRGDDGARLRLLLPQRSGREVGARRDACSVPSGHELPADGNARLSKEQRTSRPASRDGGCSYSSNSTARSIGGRVSQLL